MAKLTKRTIESADTRDADYFIWDDELPGFGLRVFKSGKRSYLVQYRAEGRTRRFAIGPHGVWTPEIARREARVLLGRIAAGENPSQERHLDAKAITVKELCQRYLEDAEKGLILGKGRRAKKPSTIYIDQSRIRRHIIPLLGTRRVKDLASTDITRFIRDVTIGSTKTDVKTKARGRAIVRGGAGTAARAVGLLGGMFTYAIEQGIIETNPVHGVRKPADRKKDRRLSEAEYRLLGQVLKRAETEDRFKGAVTIIRLLALTGCRRGEIINLKWTEVDEEKSCFRLIDSKEGASIRAVGLPVLDLLARERSASDCDFVVPGTTRTAPLIGFPKIWTRIVKGTPLADVTPHVLRHSFASIANDLGFTEVTVASLVGHSRGTITSRYIHTVDTALVMAADAIAGYVNGLLDNIEVKRKTYALDRASRLATLQDLFENHVQEASDVARQSAA